MKYVLNYDPVSFSSTSLPSFNSVEALDRIISSDADSHDGLQIYNLSTLRRFGVGSDDSLIPSGPDVTSASSSSDETIEAFSCDDESSSCDDESSSRIWKKIVVDNGFIWAEQDLPKSDYYMLSAVEEWSSRPPSIVINTKPVDFSGLLLCFGDKFLLC